MTRSAHEAVSNSNRLFGSLLHPYFSLSTLRRAMPGLGSSRRPPHLLMSIINGYDATILEYAIVMGLNGYDQLE